MQALEGRAAGSSRYIAEGYKLYRHRSNIHRDWLDYVANVSWADQAVSLETAGYLAWLCEEVNPRRVLDTGSGFSSYVMRRYARDHDAFVVSVDDDAQWMRTTATYLEKHGLSSKGLMMWTEFIAQEHEPFDLIFHDLGSQEIRLMSMPIIADLASHDAPLVFDDVHYREIHDAARATAKKMERRFVSLRTVTRDVIGRFAALASSEGLAPSKR